MNDNGALLRIDPCTEHFGRTKEHPYLTLVGIGDELFAHLLVLCLLDKADFMSWNTVVFYQFAFDFSVGIPLPSFVST